MISPIAKKSMEHMTSTIINIVVIMLVVTIVAMLLARLLGRKSQLHQQIVFSLVIVGGGYFVAMYMLPRLISS